MVDTVTLCVAWMWSNFCMIGRTSSRKLDHNVIHVLVLVVSGVHLTNPPRLVPDLP